MFMSKKESEESKKTSDVNPKISRRNLLRKAAIGAGVVVVGGVAYYLSSRAPTLPVNSTVPEATVPNATIVSTTQSSFPIADRMTLAYNTFTAGLNDLYNSAIDDAKTAKINWQQFSGTSINFQRASWGPAMDQYWNNWNTLFTQLTGITVNGGSYEAIDQEEKQRLELVGKQGIHAGFWPMYMGDVSRFAPSGGVQSLTEYLNDPTLTDLNWYDPNDFLDITQGMVNGTLYGVQKDFDGYGIMYQKDYLDEAGLAPPYNLTWDQLEQYVSALHHPEKGIYGFMATGAGEPFNDWLNMFFAYGGQYFDANWNPVFNNAVGLAATERWVKLLQTYAPPGEAAATTYDMREACAKGQVAIAMLSFYRMGMYWSEALGTPANRVGQIYTGYMPSGPAGKAALIAANCAVINGFASDTEKKACWLYLQFLTSKLGTAYLLGGSGSPEFPRKSSMQIPAINAYYSQVDNYTTFYPNTMSAIGPGCRYTYDNGFPEFSQIKELLDSALTSAISGEKTTKDALDYAAQQVQSMMSQAGYYNPGTPKYSNFIVPYTGPALPTP